jgi:hypothetical protein
MGESGWEAAAWIPDPQVAGRGWVLLKMAVRSNGNTTHLWRRPDWQPFRVTRTPSWCGHPSVTVLLPEGRWWWREVLVWEPSKRVKNSPERDEPSPGSRDIVH